MPVPRNKRKRTENPVDSTSAPSRRRRESGTGAELPEKSDLSNNRKTTTDEGNDHAETDTNNTAPQHTEDAAKEEDVAEDGNMQTESSAGTSDKLRLRALLIHRKLLLKRLQTMKTAAQDRLKEISPTTQTSDQEVASFRELLRHATAISRQQAKSETQQERSSVSLRRGSSVGKRMNAALSTISSSETGTVVPPRSSEDISSTAVPRPQSAAARKTLAVKRSATPQPQQRPASAPTLAGNNKAQLQRGPSLKAPPRQQRIPPGKSISSLSMNNTQGVICAETAALREQKAAIQAKLRALYQKRGQPYPSSKSLAKGPLKLELPPRRQTAWDVVLQEMRWMATDFREERKWKRATSRFLSRAVMANETGTKDKPTKKVEREVRTPKPPVNDHSNVYDEKVDIEMSKSVARQLSTMVSERVANVLREPIRRHDETEENEHEAVNGSAETSEHKEDKKVIDEKISSLIESVQNAKWEDLQPAKGSEKEYGIQLSKGQSEAIRGIETRWNQCSVGGLLHGSRCSGKTILICSLLWRNRNRGPQLILCPPSRLIRWGHELKRFKDLKPRVFDGHHEVDTLESNDVLLCNHMALHRLAKSDATKAFVSLVIDCRHAAGFEGSRAATSAPQKAAFCSSSLASSEWWSVVNELLTDQQMRIVIENETADGSLPTYARDLPHKQMLEILSMRTVLLLGGILLAYTHNRSGPRKLLSWARRQVKNETKKAASLFEGVKRWLLSCVKPLHVDLKTNHLDHLLTSSKEQELWNMIPIQMTQLQEKAYSECCREVQVSLSQRLSESRSVAESLLRLRRCCSFVDTETVSTRLCLFGDRRVLPNSNPSWLSLDTASRLLNGSCKLQALLSILTENCTLPSAHKSALDPLLKRTNTESFTSDATPKAKRIAVVAALPELIRMTSILLNCVGINHQLLLEPTSISEESVFNSWKANQLALCQFNSETDRVLPDFIVCSLESVSGDHGGMSIESADLVICLDEDWSGRGEMLLYHVVARSSQRRTHERKTPCRFLRLIADKTCESTFLLPSKSLCSCRKDQNKIFNCPVKLHPVGWFDTYNPDGDKENKGSEALKTTSSCYFAFPAESLLPFRDVPLSNILVTDRLPPLLSHDGDILFLPSSKNENKRKTEIRFIGSMIEIEWKAKAAMVEKNIPIHTSKAIQESFSVPAYYDSDTAFLPWEAARASISSYLQRFATVNDAIKLGPSEVFNLASPMLAIESKATCNEERITMGTDNRQSFSHSRNQNVSAASLLFYPFREIDNEDLNERHQRFNLYARSFGSLAAVPDFLDGSQGDEPLIYTPPLFPRVIESSILAKSDTELLMSSSVTAAVPLEEGRMKRAAFNRELPYAKRPRLDDELIHSEEALIDIALDMDDEQKVETTDLSVPNLVEDFGMAGPGAVPPPRDSALAAACTALVPVPHSYFQETVDFSIFGNASDAEELGRFSQREPSMKSVILFVSRKRPRGQMVRPGVSQSTPANRITVPGASGVAVSSVLGKTINGVIHDVNGSMSGKQVKKKKIPGPSDHTSAAPSSAFTRLPYSDAALPGVPSDQVLGQMAGKSKDTLKKTLLISVRQSGTGSTLFEATGFRAASTEVQNRVSIKLMRHSWNSSSAFEVGPGLPLHVVKAQEGSQRNHVSFEVDCGLWTSIVKKLGLNGEETGSESLQVATKQRESFHESLTAPCRMDFGPFQAGFLSAPSGMTSISATKHRVGISLPMGVKVSPLFGKDTNSVDWEPSQDEQLVNSVKKFGFNWNLIARSQIGFDEFCYVHDSRSASRGMSRSCRERWQVLVKKDPLLGTSITNKVQRRMVFGGKTDPLAESTDGDRVFEGSSFGATNKKDQVVSLFVPESALAGRPSSSTEPDEKDEPMDVEQTKASVPKRTFRAFNKSKSLVLVHKMPIPGVAEGEKPSIGLSHPSHVQSVEEAVTALGGSGRSEMWPLQLLLANDKRVASGDKTKTATNAPANGRTHTPAT